LVFLLKTGPAILTKISQFVGKARGQRYIKKFGDLTTGFEGEGRKNFDRISPPKGVWGPENFYA